MSLFLSVAVLLNETCSKVVAGLAFIVLAVQPGEATLSCVGGACVNAVLGKMLKRVIKQPRSACGVRASAPMGASVLCVPVSAPVKACTGIVTALRRDLALSFKRPFYCLPACLCTQRRVRVVLCVCVCVWQWQWH